MAIVAIIVASVSLSRVNALNNDVIALKNTVANLSEAGNFTVRNKAGVAMSFAAVDYGADINVGEAILDLNARLVTVEGEVSTPPTVDFTPIQDQVDALDVRVGDLEVSTTVLEGQVTTLNTNYAALNTKIDEVDTKTDYPIINSDSITIRAPVQTP